MSREEAHKIIDKLFDSPEYCGGFLFSFFKGGCSSGKIVDRTIKFAEQIL